VNKAHTPPTLPSRCPIISGCNSITENISLFVKNHAKHLVPLIPFFLQDTPDFLRQQEILHERPLPWGAFPVSIDVVGLYSNIPTEEGLTCLEKALQT
jgi:hypothetical protein